MGTPQAGTRSSPLCAQQRKDDEGQVDKGGLASHRNVIFCFKKREEDPSLPSNDTLTTAPQPPTPLFSSELSFPTTLPDLPEGPSPLSSGGSDLPVVLPPLSCSELQL